MKWTLAQTRLSYLLKQRNGLVGLCAMLLLANILLSLNTLFHSERVVVVPQGFQKEISVEGSKVSASFVEEWAAYYAHLFLTIHPQSFSYQRDQILRSVVPEAYSAVKQRLLNQEEQMKRQNLSTVFHPTAIRTKGRAAVITGNLDSYVGDKRFSSLKKTYVLKFQFKAGRLLIQSFEEIKK